MEDEDRKLLHEIIGALEEAEVADQHAERVALAKALEPDPEPDHERLAERSCAWIAKAEAANHAQALAALGAGDTPGPLAKSAGPADMAALARLSGRVELRERIAREHEAIRERPEHATSWLYNPPSGSVDETVRMVEQLNAAGS